MTSSMAVLNNVTTQFLGNTPKFSCVGLLNQLVSDGHIYWQSPQHLPVVLPPQPRSKGQDQGKHPAHDDVCRYKIKTTHLPNVANLNRFNVKWLPF